MRQLTVFALCLLAPLVAAHCGALTTATLNLLIANNFYGYAPTGLQAGDVVSTGCNGGTAAGGICYLNLTCGAAGGLDTPPASAIAVLKLTCIDPGYEPFLWQYQLQTTYINGALKYSPTDADINTLATWQCTASDATCSNRCSACTSATSCTTCAEGFTRVESGNDAYCEYSGACATNCNKCTGPNPLQCTECGDGFAFSTAQGKCHACGIDNCGVCADNNPGQCDICLPYFNLNATGVCLYNFTCVTPLYGCATCRTFNATGCGTCRPNWIRISGGICRYNGSCIANCANCSDESTCNICAHENYTLSADARHCVYNVKTDYSGGAIDVPLLGNNSVIDGGVAAALVTIADGGVVTFSGTITFQAGLTVGQDGVISIGSGATAVTGALNGATATFNLKGTSTFSVSGLADLSNAKLNLDQGAVMTAGSLTLAGGSVITLHTPSAGAAGQALVRVDGVAAFAGMIIVHMTVGLKGQEKQTLLTFGSSTGSIDAHIVTDAGVTLSRSVSARHNGVNHGAGEEEAPPVYEWGCDGTSCYVINSAPAPAPNATEAETTGLTTEQIVGIAVGASLGGIVLIFIVSVVAYNCCCKKAPAEQSAKKIEMADKKGSKKSSKSKKKESSGASSASGSVQITISISGSGSGSSN